MTNARRLMLIGVAVAACAKLTVGAQPGRDEANLGHVMTKTRLDPARQLDTAFRQVPGNAVTTAVRLHFVVKAQGDGMWTIVVQDLMGRVAEQIKPSDFLNNEYWSDDVPGGAARVRITGADSATDVQVDSYAVEVERAQEQGFIGTDNSTDIRDFATPKRAQAVAAPIARIRLMTDEDGPSCTGFLMGRDLLMTNHHCVSTDTVRHSAKVQFGADSQGAAITSFKALKIEAMNAPLDYSILRLSGDASRFGRFHVGQAASLSMRLLLIQHPDGRIKRAAFPPNCAVGTETVNGGAPKADFGHTCDTLGGSSGAPVLDWDNQKLVGLHHWTYLKNVSGSLNQAVHIRFIVEDLRAQAKNRTVAQAVVNEILAP